MEQRSAPGSPVTRHRRVRTLLLPAPHPPLSSLPKRRQQYPLRRESPDPNLFARKNAIITALSTGDQERRRRIQRILQRKRSAVEPQTTRKSIARSTSDRELALSPLSASPTESRAPLFVLTPTPSFSSLPLLSVSPYHRKPNRHELSRRAFGAVRHFLQLRLPTLIIPKLVFLVPQTPLSARNSKQFLMACRMGETDVVDKMLRDNRWLALEYDKVRKTALHWAARRNHMKIMESLLFSGAYIDARDCIGRTPLFLAAKAGHLSAVSMLLLRKADPFLRTYGHKSIVKATASASVRRLLIKSMQLTVLLRFVDKSKRKCLWESEIIEFFKADLRVFEHRVA